MALQLIPKRRTLSNPSLIHLFSTSSSSSSIPADSDDRNDHSKSSTSDSPLSSYFSDVKASLSRQQRSSPPPLSPRTPPTPASKGVSVEEIRNNLAKFRRKSDPSPPANSGSTPSFQDLYQQNVVNNADERSSGWRLSFDVIRGSLNQMRASNNAPQTGRRGSDPLSLSSFKSSLRLRPSDSPSEPSDSPSAPSRTRVFGGTDPLPQSVFGKEIRERKDGDEPSAMKRVFVKMYDHTELGKRLKQLRPDEKDKGEGWFSIEELNQRLTRLRELEEKEPESIIPGMQFKDFRSGLETLKRSVDKMEKTNLQKHGILGLMSRTPEFMLQPPKEHLVEKYFHPDNMSSAEKMKLELAKVRDEFKLSESDCGSARVQVAQLTTKIKHLSAVLHKKDKHSRKGLVAMVQRRKRLLKYLRRTDWDSYCFVLDKLGLRDNPDYKN